MSKSKMAMCAALALVVIYIVNSARGSIQASHALVEDNRAYLYENCKQLNATIAGTPLEKDIEDCEAKYPHPSEGAFVAQHARDE